VEDDDDALPPAGIHASMTNETRPD
jgi:hypothetical protein